jgi:hypothetical protein
MKQRHQANIFQPTYPVWIVDYDNKVEKDLTKDWRRLIIGTDSGDDHVHVDAKPGEVHYGKHGTNASNHSLSLGLMRVSKVHDVLKCPFDMARERDLASQVGWRYFLIDSGVLISSMTLRMLSSLLTASLVVLAHSSYPVPKQTSFAMISSSLMTPWD